MSLSSEPVETPLSALLREAEWQLDVCNSCRYCEGYCAVFPALARRSELTSGDISHIANICHDCRACLTACMYAPPHEFGINPPKILSEVRRATYDGPRSRGQRLSRRSTALVGFVATVAIVIAVALVSEGTRAWLHADRGAASPYRVLSYGVLLAVGAVPFLAAAVMVARRGIAYWHHTRGPLGDLLNAGAWAGALADAATLRYLKGGGAECDYPDDRPSPLRRRLHGWVAYGFLACVLSTVSAAVEQDILGIRPPYPWLSVPVVSGTLGGIGIAVGCIGLIVLKAQTVDEDIDVPMRSRDYVLLSALLVLAVTGIAVLLTRTTAVYAPILVVHLSAVAISFLGAAYSKFAHVLYRMLALVQDRIERAELVSQLIVSDPRTPAVDVHSHGVPPALIEELRRGSAFGIEIAGDEDVVLTFPGTAPLRPVPRGMSDLGERLAWMDRAGIEVQLVAPWLDIMGSELDPELGQAWVARLNDALAAWCSASAGRVIPLAGVHPSDPDAACTEALRATRERGCAGVILPTHSRYGALRVAGWEAFWSLAEAEQIPLLVHPPVQGPTSLAGGASLAFRSLWGRAMDTTVAAGDLVLEGLFERFPNLRVLLVEGGGYLPYQAGRLDAQVAIGRVGTRVRSSTHPDQVGHFHFDTTLMAKEAITMLVQQFGERRVLLGSDYPFFVVAAEPRGEIEAASLGAQTSARLLSGNARELFPASAPGRG